MLWESSLTVELVRVELSKYGEYEVTATYLFWGLCWSPFIWLQGPNQTMNIKVRLWSRGQVGLDVSQARFLVGGIWLPNRERVVINPKFGVVDFKEVKLMYWC